MPLAQRYGYADTPHVGDASLAWTTLTGSMSSGATTLNVGAVSDFPSAVEFDIIVGVLETDGTLSNAEKFHVTGISSLQLTVSAAAVLTHAAGESVYHGLTAFGLMYNPGVMTDTGDTQYLGALGRPIRLAAGGDGTYVRYAGGVPTASAIQAGDLPAHSADLLTTGTVALARLSALTTTQFASAAVSQWTNDAGYLTAASGAPIGATYITQTPSAGLSAEQALSALATGLLKNTTTTGVLSIALPGTDYAAPFTITAGQVAYATATDTLGGDAGLIYSNNTFQIGSYGSSGSRIYLSVFGPEQITQPVVADIEGEYAPGVSTNPVYGTLTVLGALTGSATITGSNYSTIWSQFNPRGGATGELFSGTIDRASNLYLNSMAWPDGWTGTITEFADIWVNTPQSGGSGHVVTSYGLYFGDRAGKATNPYYSWFDSQGVLRVKEDNTFNSVGQAIQALYNPQFTKYTPGATNYERIVQQWESNVATIRTEAGGTGTLRPINLAGSTVQLNGKTVTLSGNLTTTGAFNPIFAIPSSSTWMFPSGGGNLVLDSVATLSSLTSVGTIGTGTWNATAIADGKIASALTGKTYNGLTLTSTTGTFTLAAAKVLTVNNTLTLAGTDSTTMTFPSTSATIARTDAANTFTLANDTTMTVAGGSVTGSGTSPFLSVTGTWNTSATPAALKVNVTNTASATGLIADFQVGGVSKASVNKDGLLNTGSVQFASGGYLATINGTIYIASGGPIFKFMNAAESNYFFLIPSAPHVMQMGADVNGAAINQTIQAANGITGTDRVGANITYGSGKGTGAGAASSHFFDTPTVGTTGTTAQTRATRLTVATAAITATVPIVGGANYLQYTEMAAPAAGAADTVRIYAVDNGAGKTQLMALFSSGAAQQLAIQP